MRVLAFTCSKHRPVALRNVVMQMAVQTYPLDYAIYINSPLYRKGDNTADYRSLLTDLREHFPGKLWLDYGPSMHQHFNHMNALRQADIEQYDLFLKIDDDDIYRVDYVERVVRDRQATPHDVSAQHSRGAIFGIKWFPEFTKKGVGGKNGLPATLGFSRRGIREIMSLDGKTPYWEDRYWGEHIRNNTDLVRRIRPVAGTHHMVVHGENTTVGGWLKKTDLDSKYNLRTRVTSLQATKLALRLLARAFARLPATIIRRLTCRRH